MKIAIVIAALLLSVASSGTNSGCSEVDLGIRGNSKIFVCSDTVIRVAHIPQGGSPKGESLVVNAKWDPVAYKVSNATDNLTIITNRMQVVYNFDSDSVSFRDSNGNIISEELHHSLNPSTTPGVFSVSQTWKTDTSEGIYGGGQYQDGFINWAGTSLSMVQFNTQAIVPFFLSTKGYGLLWDSYSWTHLNDGIEIPLTINNQTATADVVLSPGKHNFQVRLCRPWGCGGTVLKMTLTNNITGEVLTGQDWNELANIPDALIARVNVKEGGDYIININYDGDHPETLYMNSENSTIQLRSEASEAVDYYFVWGDNNMNNAISQYRRATGAAYLYGRYAYGFWQCKNRYHNKSELLNAAIEFRKRRIPVDNIVQDWMYWGNLGWGPHWDQTTYPNPADMVKTLHENSFHFMVSVWAKFDKKTTFYKEMNSKGYIINGSIYYDPYNPEARELYYNFSNENHFKIGVDALWLDATEPEALPNYDNKVFLGPGNQYLNPFSLMTTSAIADGLRRDYSTSTGARVFSLTRSSFAGQQRTGAALWSGDTTATWDTLRRQIAASLNYQMSGIPYWSQDIGGFFRPNDMYTNIDYWCMLTRWFQFGVFTPIFRVHGTGNTEIWNYGPYVQNWVVNSSINLRYRLLPYIYSGFRKVEQEGYTMQRAMPLDFSGDVNTHDIADQFMFGESLLIAPIYSPNDTNSDLATRSVYFPAGGWWNFNTGEMSGATVGWHRNISCDIIEIPIFVRAGSIIIMGPAVQHTDEKADPLEIRIYRNSDANFTLFEDDGESPSMEADHQFSEIQFSLSEEENKLTVSDRRGSFPGMLSTRTLNIVVVSKDHGTGASVTTKPDKTVLYNGSQVIIPLDSSLSQR